MWNARFLCLHDFQPVVHIREKRGTPKKITTTCGFPMSVEQPHHNLQTDISHRCRTTRHCGPRLRAAHDSRCCLAEADLRIGELQWGDSGVYFCKVVIADDLEGKNEGQLELLVLGRPAPQSHRDFNPRSHHQIVLVFALALSLKLGDKSSGCRLLFFFKRESLCCSAFQRVFPAASAVTDGS